MPPGSQSAGAGGLGLPLLEDREAGGGAIEKSG
jgi:hypothetical protein